ncbi:LptF/LptG family permease, partial [Vibrio splendidus]
NVWTMRDVEVTSFENEIQVTKESLPTFSWETSLAPDKLAIVTVKPEELSLSGLYDYVSYLKASEQDAARYELALWRKITQPISIAVMM